MQDNINYNIPAHHKERFPSDFTTLQKGIEAKDIPTLSRVITLVENSKHRYQAELMVFLSMLPKTHKTIRVAVTGPPGAGKSTFIEVLGLGLIEKGFSVAVLAIDPSSDRSRGSILGDKTRMEKLSVSPSAYIRPSSNALESGGVRTSTFQTIRLCEAAGFDFVLVETVGVGQSEIAASKLTDLMLLLLTPTGGDELQGIKKGIVELADMILINKADGINVQAAENSRKEYSNAVHFARLPDNLLAKTDVRTISALENKGIEDITELIVNLLNDSEIQKNIDLKRNLQNKTWFKKQAIEMLEYYLHSNSKIKRRIEMLSEQQEHFQGLASLAEEFREKLKHL